METDSIPLSRGSRRFVAGMFDLSVLILGSVIIMLPSLLVFIDAMKRPDGSATLSLYFVMFLTGGVVAVFDIVYRVAVPYFLDGQSLGMRFFRMRMLAENGGVVSIKSLLVKALVIFFLVIFTFGLYYFVEAVALFASTNHRSFADTLSQTVVVDLADDE